MNILNAYLTKRASVLPYQAATGGSGTAYYNEGGSLGQVEQYNKAPIGGMNFNELAYTMNDAALWFVPPIFKAPQMLSKVPKLGKFGTTVYNAYNRTPASVKTMAANTAITSLPYLGDEYAVTNGVMNRPAPQGVVGRYGLPLAQAGYNSLQDSYNNAMQPINSLARNAAQCSPAAAGRTMATLAMSGLTTRNMALKTPVASTTMPGLRK